MSKTIYSVTGRMLVPRPERFVIEVLCEGDWVELWSYKKPGKAMKNCDKFAVFFEAARVVDLGE